MLGTQREAGCHGNWNGNGTLKQTCKQKMLHNRLDEDELRNEMMCWGGRGGAQYGSEMVKSSR